jgi:hypothetical protein
LALTLSELSTPNIIKIDRTSERIIDEAKIENP